LSDDKPRHLIQLELLWTTVPFQRALSTFPMMRMQKRQFDSTLLACLLRPLRHHKKLLCTSSVRSLTFYSSTNPILPALTSIRVRTLAH
jgi:hypothetical protein